MNRPTDSALLNAWEQGLNQPLIYSNLMLLSLIYPGVTIDQLLDFSIGERDAALWHLRRLLFGDTLDTTATCPNCTAQVEWEARASDFQLQSLKTDVEPVLYEYDFNGKPIPFRLPNSRDILALANSSANTSAEMQLLQACIGVDIDTAVLTAEAKAQIAQEMAALDPQADIRLQMSCPECDHQWELVLDILSYLWEEVNEWANGMMLEIALLAKHFSWSETDILNLSRFRRNRYLKLIG